MVSKFSPLRLCKQEGTFVSMSEKNFSDLVELPQEAVEEALLRARPYNLESEVMLSAIQWALRNPEASVAECCAYAINTWME